jgi:hypothetical protein
MTVRRAAREPGKSDAIDVPAVAIGRIAGGGPADRPTGRPRSLREAGAR